MPTPPPTPGWYDDPDGRRRWWSGSHWGAFAPWDEQDAPERPSAPERPRLDRSLTFDPTAAGRIARAQPTPPSAPGPGSPSPPVRSSGFLPAGAGAGAAGPSAGGAGARDRSARPAKRLPIAYALAIVLGLLGGHRFYLGRVSSATLQMMLSFAAAAAVVVQQGAQGAPLWLLAVPVAAAAWWIADLLRLAGMVEQRNRRLASPGAD